MTAQPRRWGTKSDVAEHLQVSTKTVERMTERGELRAYAVGRRLVRYDMAEVDAMLAADTEAVD
ncbi:putative phage excisionase [Mycolicibacterium canariasense]|uniref:Putative phage excisionase n=1 Tax=Mycolicibacterium canariasense TaxID=228230 RepID=A0A100WIJ7_MYCCR|nr:helix-turn-helix domain-containing protein [Mycolicibacterium canariasense]ORU98084.1 hypothetical protein AWB94_29005 [Mycolicibacterium canariasense]GAS98830.1 putative phage excisionase [Mycolicibacterium canariasense]